MDVLTSDDKKLPLSLVVVGHIDAGKSTTSGHLIFKLGKLDERAMSRLTLESASEGKASFQFAWVMDKLKNERQRGITIDTALGSFETPKCAYTIIDAPGHRDFIKNMISGTASADSSLLVISASVGEFEAGFSERGQTKEHALLAYTMGVKRMIVAVNKMDQTSVGYSEQRFRFIENSIRKYLKSCGFKHEVPVLPISGWKGDNILTKSPDMPWYTGPSLLEVLDSQTAPERPSNKPLRLPILDVYRVAGIGTVVVGRVESGILRQGAQIQWAPHVGVVNSARVVSIELPSNTPVLQAEAGTKVAVNLRNVSLAEIRRGWVIGEEDDPPRAITSFEAQIIVLNHEVTISLGYQVVVDCHTAHVFCKFTKLLAILDSNSQETLTENPKALKAGETAVVEMTPVKGFCVEPISEYPALARFSMRDMRKTIAVGVVRSVSYTTRAIAAFKAVPTSAKVLPAPAPIPLLRKGPPPFLPSTSSSSSSSTSTSTSTSTSSSSTSSSSTSSSSSSSSSSTSTSTSTSSTSSTSSASSTSSSTSSTSSSEPINAVTLTSSAASKTQTSGSKARAVSENKGRTKTPFVSIHLQSSSLTEPALKELTSATQETSKTRRDTATDKVISSTTTTTEAGVEPGVRTALKQLSEKNKSADTLANKPVSTNPNVSKPAKAKPKKKSRPTVEPNVSNVLSTTLGSSLASLSHEQSTFSSSIPKPLSQRYPQTTSTLTQQPTFSDDDEEKEEELKQDISPPDMVRQTTDLWGNEKVALEAMFSEGFHRVSERVVRVKVPCIRNAEEKGGCLWLVVVTPPNYPQSTAEFFVDERPSWLGRAQIDQLYHRIKAELKEHTAIYVGEPMIYNVVLVIEAWLDELAAANVGPVVKDPELDPYDPANASLAPSLGDRDPTCYTGSISSIIGQLPENMVVTNVENIMRGDLAWRFENFLGFLHKRHDHYIKTKMTKVARANCKWLDYCVAFHGTSRQNIASIVRSGLLMPEKDGNPVQVACGTRYGRGIYLSPSMDFAANYSDWSEESRLLVCAALPGKCYKLSAEEDANGDFCDAPLFPDHDSHMSNNEEQLILFHESQVLPCYVIHFRPKAAGEEAPQNIVQQGRTTMKVVKGDDYKRKKAIQRVLTAEAGKNLPSGFGPAGANFIVEEIGAVSDDEEVWGEYQDQRRDEYQESTNNSDKIDLTSWQRRAIIKREELQAEERAEKGLKERYIQTGVMFDVNPNQGKAVLPPLPTPKYR